MKEDIVLLAIESSCDETAVAVVKNGREILSDVIASQADFHEQFGGVVPELASRMHVDAVYPAISKALSDANVTLDDLVKAFEDFLNRVDLEKPIHTKITKKELSVEDRIVNIKDKFKKQKRIDFFDLFEVKSKEYVVVTFLAILSMAKKQEISINQDKNFNNITIMARK